MQRIAMGILAAYFFLTGIYLFFFPQLFYDQTPGLSAMGPFNFHFIRDVSFAFLVSGAGLAYAAKRNRRDTAIVAAAWPFLHALFHLTIWGHRGFPLDQIWFFDAAAVVLPGFLALYLAW